MAYTHRENDYIINFADEEAYLECKLLYLKEFCDDVSGDISFVFFIERELYLSVYLDKDFTQEERPMVLNIRREQDNRGRSSPFYHRDLEGRYHNSLMHARARDMQMATSAYHPNPEISRQQQIQEMMRLHEPGLISQGDLLSLTTPIEAPPLSEIIALAEGIGTKIKKEEIEEVEEKRVSVFALLDFD